MTSKATHRNNTTVSTVGTSKPFRQQLLKWVGNKQKMAEEIIGYFPNKFGTYYEPFLGSGGVLGVLAPKKAVASDIFKPLIEIWQLLDRSPTKLVDQYDQRYALINKLGKKEAYELVRSSYNKSPNGMDLLFLCRACYGGVVRFRKQDGFMSTPVGPHTVMTPEKFAQRALAWKERVSGTSFVHQDFAAAISNASAGDLVYCDPPYVDSQSILYGAQSFSVGRLFEAITEAKERGVFVALSIDGTKYSGKKLCDLPVPSGLFEREEFVSVGRSMLKRFQMDGQSLEAHEVTDRLLLTY